MTDGFQFDLNTKRTRLGDGALVAALTSVAKALGDGAFSTTQYDSLPGRRPHSTTIIDRFGSRRKALVLIGITTGVREKRYSPELLIANLETVWKQLGYSPGKRQIAALGEKVSESPYKRHWGSVRARMRSDCGVSQREDIKRTTDCRQYRGSDSYNYPAERKVGCTKTRQLSLYKVWYKPIE